MKVKIWSEGQEEFIELEITEEQHQAAMEFIQKHKEGDFFCSDEFHNLFTEEQNEAADTGTASFVAAFLPDGFGCAQHGTDDFAIEWTDE